MSGSSFTWEALTGIDFGPFRANRFEPGEQFSADFAPGVAEELQAMGAIRLVSGPDNDSKDSAGDGGNNPSGSGGSKRRNS